MLTRVYPPGGITRWVKLKGYMGRAEGGWRDYGGDFNGGDFSRPRASIMGMPVIDAWVGD